MRMLLTNLFIDKGINLNGCFCISDDIVHKGLNMAGDIANLDRKTHIEQTKKEWLRQQETYRKMFYRKSKLPPFNIEPFPHERERLPFKMTVVDRALREQWVKDQHLSPNEPRHVPEIFPKNVFRRMYGTPWNFVATKLSTSGLVSSQCKSRW